jgi:hypothetical protein
MRVVALDRPLLQGPGMNRSASLLAASLLALPASTACHASSFDLDLESGAVWNSKADVRVPNVGGSPFSLTKDLGARDPGGFFRSRLTWHPAERHDISLLYAPLELDYRGQFNRTIRFAGTDFAAGTQTNGTFRFDSYRLTYRYNFVQTEDCVFGMGLTAKVRDAEVRLSQAGASASNANTGFVPLLNYRLLWRFSKPFSLLSEGDALGASKGHAIDASAAIQWHATDSLSFRVGYRILDGGADSDTVYTFNRFHYATAGVNYQF